ncbi:TPA_asm: coat protein [ssRNA phage Gerhypos.3_25]|uniref:Coat protein n=2 Tax=Fiersviridae TaxID=2842319 RepID=A0A8S5KZ60_9VIRU|nr:coat protein [ssRNA phage Gerhypos.3_25]QDH87003.1 MAG: hypothetical protein H3Bulk42356_000003 [Leviviridae sp.]DAD50463.1 TPA_asm: coat protein [ssRNA phage Gerhypos.3_25]
MPAFAPLTLNGLSGADHVFAPLGIDAKGVATFTVPGTSPVGDEVLTVGVSRAPNGGRIKTEIRLAIPKVQDVDVGGVIRPTLVRKGNITLTITTDPTAPHADRDELVLLLSSMLNNIDAPSIVAVLTALTPYY